MRAAIRTEGLTVRFGGATALDDVSIRVNEQRIHGLVGPNGSGKTTLLNAVSGFVDSRGKILIGDTIVTGTPAHRRARLGFGRTFQNPKIPAGMTVGEVLQLGEHPRQIRPWGTVAFRPYRAGRAQHAFEARAGDLLERLGVSRDVLGEPLETLASGAVKMIDIARALVPNPRVVALDEPTSGMNEQEIGQLLAHLQTLREEGTTILVVEHNLRVLADICHTLTVLDLGRVLCEGPPAQVFRRRDVIEAYLGESHDPASPATHSGT